MRDITYYDGMCGMCRRSVRVMRALDVLGRLEFRDMLADPQLPVPLEVALRGMVLRTGRGRVLTGFSAARRAWSRTLLGPVAWMWYIPGISQVAAAVYRHVAANRRRDCPLPPASLPLGGPARILRP